MNKASNQFPPEVILPDFFDDDDATTTTTTTKSRRVSFGTNFVKEFIVGSAVSAQCVSEYEETFISSDSSNANSSQSVIDNNKSNQHTFNDDENHSNQKLVTFNAPVLDTNNMDNMSKVSKFSSTICFSADSPTADLEFTGGCINLAKSILKKKNQDMTVIISSKPKVGKDEIQPKDKTIYFEGSQIDMSVTNFLSKNDSNMEEDSDNDEIKHFDENDIHTSNLLKTETPNVTNYNSCMSINDSLKINKLNEIPLNLIMKQLGNDDVCDLDELLFYPKKSFNDVLNSGPFNVSIEIENSSSNLTNNSENLILQNCANAEGLQTPVEDLNGLLSKSSTIQIENSEEKFCGSKDMNFLETSKELDSAVKDNVSSNSKEIFGFGKEFSMTKSPEHSEDTESRMEMDSFISQEQILAVEKEMTLEMTKYAEEPMESEHEMSLENPFSEMQHGERESENLFHDTTTEMEVEPEPHSSAMNQPQQKVIQNSTKTPLENNVSEKESKLPDQPKNKTESIKIYNDTDLEKSVSSNHSSLILNSQEAEPTEEQEVFHKNSEFEKLVSTSTEVETSVSFDTGKETENIDEKLPTESPIITKVTKIIEKIDTINIDEQNKTESKIVAQTEKPRDDEDKDCNEILKLVKKSENYLELEMKEINEKENFEERENLCKKQKGNLTEEIKPIGNAEEDITEFKEMNPTEVEIRSYDKMIEKEGYENYHCIEELQQIHNKENELIQDISFKEKEFNRDIVEEEDSNQKISALENETNQNKEIEENQSDRDEKSTSNNISPNDFKSDDHTFVNLEESSIMEESVATSAKKNVQLIETRMTSEDCQNNDKTKVSVVNYQEKSDNLEGKQHKKSSEVEKAKLDEKNVEKVKSSKYKEPPMMNLKVLENLKEQSRETGCIWEIESVKHGGESFEAEWTFRFKLMKSQILARIELQESDQRAYSDVKSIKIEKNIEKTPRRKEYGPTLDFGFEKFQSLVEQERKLIKTVLNVPYFLDRMNIFGSKLNGYLNQMYEILTKYPGSRLSGSQLSFRVFSFPLFFSVVVSINLVDFYGLSKSSLSFFVHFGNFDEKKFCSIFENCLELETPLTEFVLRSTEYLFELEKKTGRTTKRGHIRLLPRHFH